MFSARILEMGVGNYERVMLHTIDEDTLFHLVIS